MSKDEARSLMAALSEPFDPVEVKWKPATVSGNRALAIAYVDARAIQDRLDDVLGVDGWQDDYECLPDGSVVCRLKIRLASEWITKMDVGGPSEQPDGGDRLKAAFSDALKRAAVKFGIGRYLYRLAPQWVDYDPQRRQFAKPPQLPQKSPQAGKVSRKAPDPSPAAPAQSSPNGAGISEEQWKQLAAVCKARGIPSRKLLAHYKVTKPRQLPAGAFEEIFKLASAADSVLLPNGSA